MEQVCTKCEASKDVSDYSRIVKEKEKRSSVCKDCIKDFQREHYKKNKKKYYEKNKRFRERRKTDINVLISMMYTGMKKRRVDTCDKKDFIELSIKSDTLKILFKNWGENGHKREDTPTVDRIDNSKGYSVGNMQFMTLSQNYLKGFIESLN